MRSESSIILIGILSLLTDGRCLIIPDEVPSLLSLVYSNIPPIKKGTDSRLGFGFRLGPHADFQVLLELGPQTNTDPIGGGEEEPPAKRDTLVINNPYTLVDYFRKLQGGNKAEEVEKEREVVKKENISNTEGGKWMKWWKKNVLGDGPIGKIKFKKVPGIDDLSAEGSENVVLDFRDPTKEGNTFVNQLRRLYNRQSNFVITRTRKQKMGASSLNDKNRKVLGEKSQERFDLSGIRPAHYILGFLKFARLLLTFHIMPRRNK